MLDAICDVLAGRRLIWFGIRGEDAEALLQLEALAGSFAITAPLAAPAVTEDVTLEEFAGVRPDLDRYDLDFDVSPPAEAFRQALAAACHAPCVVMTYRPCEYISELAFNKRETVAVAGPLKSRQQAFEHKPWVETSLAERGIRTLEWRYVTPDDVGEVERMLAAGPVVLRKSRTSGGVGIALAYIDADLESVWPGIGSAVIAATPFVADSLPVNVSGCVFRDGTVRVHPASLQLIGVRSCIDRRFGYCGNDFAAARLLPSEAVLALDRMVREIGMWLWEERYLGAFGIDALVVSDRVLFVELNARFQGSSTLSARAANLLGVSDLFSDHLAACLGVLPPSDGIALTEWVEHQPSLAHVIVHNMSGSRIPATDLQPPSVAGVEVKRLPPAGIAADPGAVLYRLVFDCQITSNGATLEASAEELIGALGGRPVRNEANGAASLG